MARCSKTTGKTLLDLKAPARFVPLGSPIIMSLSLKRPRRSACRTLQPPFSAIKREVGKAELAWCAAHDTGVIVYSPMQAGLLSGAFTKERAASLPPMTGVRAMVNSPAKSLRVICRLQPPFRGLRTGMMCRPPRSRFAWTLAWPGVTAAIVGAPSPAQVDGWHDAAWLELTEADMNEIGAVIERSGAGYGPAKP